MFFSPSGLCRPGSTFQANSRVVAGLLSPPRTGRVHQRRLSLEHPFPPQTDRPESGLRRFWPHSLGLLRIWRTGGRIILGFQEAFLGSLSRSPTSSQATFDSAPGQLCGSLLSNSSWTPASPGGFCTQTSVGSVEPSSRRGEPPVCSKTKPWAPPRRKLASQFPMV